MATVDFKNKQSDVLNRLSEDERRQFDALSDVEKRIVLDALEKGWSFVRAMLEPTKVAF